MSAHGGH
jgi:hypothetical protein